RSRGNCAPWRYTEVRYNRLPAAAHDVVTECGRPYQDWVCTKIVGYSSVKDQSVMGVVTSLPLSHSPGRRSWGSRPTNRNATSAAARQASYRPRRYVSHGTIIRAAARSLGGGGQGRRGSRATTPPWRRPRRGSSSRHVELGSTDDIRDVAVGPGR